jgi:hypothetical protein
MKTNRETKNRERRTENGFVIQIAVANSRFSVSRFLRTKRVIGVVVFGLAAIMLIGCNNTPPPKPVKITGKVQYANGKPVTGMVLTFNPREEINKNDRPIFVLQGTDGRFEIECLPGKYKVTMVPIPSNPGSMGNIQLPPTKEPEKGKTSPQQMLLNNFRSPDTSPWEINILPEGTLEQVLIVR